MVLPILAWVFTGLLLVLLLTCVAAARGSLRRNRWFGVKLPALERSDAAWRAGHAVSVVPAAVAFVVALIASILGLFAPAIYWVTIVAAVGGVIWVFVRATRAADRVTP
ncbi:SdpI family protein [Microbacterium sp. B2969]|uniref:SdpI family protein n=1 Tax=Microbacterium alkaliflavum TaxID=3248839 RepID=A0ABW7Q6V7_9MICO